MEYSYSYDVGDGGGIFGLLFGGCYSLVWLVVAVLVIAGLWKMFQKAGQPGWGAIIPFYNMYLLLQIAGRPGWWLILYFIPLVNIVIVLIVALDVAKAFGKDTIWGIGIWLFPEIFYLVLGFGSAQYVGPGGRAVAAYAPPQPSYAPPAAPPAPPAPQPPAEQAPPQDTPPAPPSA